MSGIDDLYWLGLACDLARLCPPSKTAFSVGAVIVSAAGEELARGHSRESDPHEHAEEAALARIDPADPRLATATIYSSLEPCGRRRSRPRTCAELIIAAGIRRVVFAWREPAVFVEATGADRLAAAGVTLVELGALAPRAREPNAHLLG
jgi:Pyrimidine deaminase